MKKHLLRLWLFLILLALPLCAQADTPKLYTAQADLYIHGKLPTPPMVMTIDFDVSAFNDFVYDKLIAQAEEIDVTTFALTPEALRSAYSNLINDSPELFYLDTLYYYATSGDIVSTFHPCYLYTGADLQSRIRSFNAAVSRIASYANRASTTLGKLMLANEYFCLNFEYDNSYSIYGPDQLFSQGTGVCQAYMLGYAAVLDRLGIPNTHATSTAMNHTWNLVQVDGNWYHIDVTWNDPSGLASHFASYSYFMLSDSGIRNAEHHNWAAQVSAGNSKYDNFFWRSTYHPLPVLGSTVYYVAPDAQDYALRTIKAYNLSTQTESTLFSYSLYAADGSCSFYDGIDPFWVTDSRIYYAVQNALYSANRDGSNPRLEYVAADPSAFIWAVHLDGSTLNLFLSSTPFHEGLVVPFTSQDIRLTLTPAQLEMRPGESAGLTALLGGIENFALPLTWNSSDESLAVVDESGCISALSPGLCAISVQCGETMRAECRVLVHSDSPLLLPQDVVRIEAEAFTQTSAQEIILPEGITAVGERAFADCENLILATLPATLESIDPTAFAGNDALTLLCTPGSAAEAFAAEQNIPVFLLPE